MRRERAVAARREALDPLRLRRHGREPHLVRPLTIVGVILEVDAASETVRAVEVTALADLRLYDAEVTRDFRTCHLAEGVRVGHEIEYEIWRVVHDLELLAYLAEVARLEFDTRWSVEERHTRYAHAAGAWDTVERPHKAAEATADLEKVRAVNVTSSACEDLASVVPVAGDRKSG